MTRHTTMALRNFANRDMSVTSVRSYFEIISTLARLTGEAI